MCRIHILSTHSVLLDIFTVINTHYTPYVHIYTHNNMRRCNRLYNKPDMQCHLMVSSGSRKVVVLVQCVRVVQLNWVKVQCMAYCKVGVCSRVYYFWLFIVLIAWGEKLFLSRLVWDRMLRRRLPEGSRESSLWDWCLESLMIFRVFLVHRLV